MRIILSTQHYNNGAARWPIGVLCLTLGVALSANSLPAQAQGDDELQLEEIVVTGSLIKRRNLQISTPVNQIDADYVLSAGSPNLGNLLNDLPAFTSTYSTGNSSRFIGTAGLSALDLRGLGVGRTLVLVGGKRQCGRQFDSD